VPIYRLASAPVFPPPSRANAEGLLAWGGDLSVDWLLAAYRSGIFPWYSEGQPILWWSPDPRMVLRPADLHCPRRLERIVASDRFTVTLDRAFRRVIEACSTAPREGQCGTWITPDMIAAYTRLHEAGYAHSVEAWSGDQLAGGLYGVSLGGCFFGESMFTNAPDASKTAFVRLVRQLDTWEFGLIDCQMHTEHLARFGAHEVPRKAFLAMLANGLRHPTRQGTWTYDLQPG